MNHIQVNQRLGELIRRKRKEKRISNEALAKIIGMRRETTWRNERGINEYRIQAFLKAALVLGITFDEIISAYEGEKDGVCETTN